MRPLFTFVIPAYNGSPFIDNSINSLLNDRILDSNVWKFFEVIIINDGSKDDTLAKSNKIASKWNQIIGKEIIRVIDKKNGQYGSVINRGIKEAKGIYFKVLDVDDTFSTISLIEMIRMIYGLDKQVDVIYTDYTLEKVAINLRQLQSLRKTFIPYKINLINEVKFPNDLITMHSVIYRLDFLKEIEFEQIEGVYYSDSQYSLIPLAYASSFYYLEIPLYRYFIGRSEQSINLKVMVKNRIHQLKVLERIWKESELEDIESKKLRNYFITVLKQMAQWQIMLISFDKSIKGRRQYTLKFLKLLKELQPDSYWNITNSSLFWLIRITRGHGIPWMLKIGAIIYSKFKKNILAEWD